MEELLDYWKEYPPAHIILAAVHLKRTGRSKPRSELEELKGSVLSAGGGVKPASDLPEHFRKK